MQNSPVSVLKKRTLIEVKAYPDDRAWGMEFSGGLSLYVECLWRVIFKGRIYISSSDHGHTFGNEKTVDAPSLLREVVASSPITETVLAPVTSDLTLQFSNNAELQLIVASTGYESWSLTLEDGSQLQVLGGGTYCIFKR